MKTYHLESYTTQDRKTHWQVVAQWVEPPPSKDERPPAPAGYTLEPLRAELRTEIIGAQLTLEEAAVLQEKAVKGEIE